MDLDPAPWARALERSFGCHLDAESWSNEAAVSVWGPCPGALHKRGLRLEGRFDLGPLAAALRAQGVVATLYAPPFPLLRLEGPGRWDLGSPGRRRRGPDHQGGSGLHGGSR